MTETDVPMPLKASEVAPDAFSAKSATVDDKNKEDDLDYDIGNLAAFDNHAFDQDQYDKNPEEYLVHRARDNVQLLFNKLFSLDAEKTADGPVVTLPEPSFDLPRAKPVPKPKPETKWQKYAKEKDIRNRKRDRMVWDEQKEEWRPRWGYKRTKDDQHDWLIEYKAGEDSYVDKFAERRLNKKQRVLKNKMQHMRNLEDAHQSTSRKSGHRAAVDTSDLVTSNVGKKGRVTHGKGKKGTSAFIKMAQRSSASMGKFDKRAATEKKMDRGGRRRTKQSNVGAVKNEHSKNIRILDRVLGADGNSMRVISRGSSGGKGKGKGRGKGKGKR